MHRFERIAMSNVRMPVLFISHGGGPWPYIEDMRRQFAKTAAELGRLPQALPAKPRAILAISGHWEAPAFTVSTGEHPPTEYDYYGFPPHTYQIRYPAPGAPVLAQQVRGLLGAAGIDSGEDARRGFDHGVFVPLVLMYPQADVPVVMLSLKAGYDPAEHFRAGQALQALRDDGVLIIGSGLTYHNMRGFGRPESLTVSQQFEQYLHAAVAAPDAQMRRQRLLQWEAAPAARQAHPREDHLLPLFVAAGASGNDTGDRLFMERALGVDMASYRFG
jgi:aromatic ring-opening dioxygenase catalytic subunit (LigB family)